MRRFGACAGRWLLTLLVLLGLGGAAQGLEPAQRGPSALSQYKVEGWQTEQGLPLNTVQALLQTRDGYLWVGTAGGLARFDGQRFTGFGERDSPELAGQPIFGLMEDAQSRLWIGHAGGAVIYHEGRFEPVLDAELSGKRRVWAFAQAADGSVWIATENGLVHWNQGRARLYQEAQGLPTKRLRALCFDRDGVLWIATSGAGLVSYRDGQFKTFDRADGLPNLQVRAVLADPQGGVWATTDGGGLLHLNEGVLRRYTRADGLPAEHLTALARDAQGSLWIGSWGAGLIRMHQGRFSIIDQGGGLAGNQIWSLLPDREGGVWIGTWVGGLNRLRQRPFLAFGVPEGLSNDNVRAILHDRRGRSWVSTGGGGLNLIEGHQVQVLGRAQGLPSEELSALLEDRDGALWIGSYTAGLARLREDRVQVFGTAQGLPGSEVRSLLQDRDGGLWVGTRSGLARWLAGRFEPVQAAGLPQEGVVAMLQGRDGTLWFGTAGQGLVRLKAGMFKTFTVADGLVSDWILSLYEDGAGNLWIGSNGEGMNRLRGERITAIRTRDGLWDGLAQSIIEDGQGRLWMSCNRGFYSVPRSELEAFADGRIGRVHATGYGPGDALRSTTFAGGLQPAGARAADGRIWLPSAGGLVIIDPARLPGAGPAPAARIEKIQVDGTAQPASSRVVLPPGALPLQIRYTAMTLQNADRARFRYRMEGLTHGWVDAGNVREAAFPSLPHGDYRFALQASIDGEHWSESEAGLEIGVRPRLYETVWFQALAALALLGTAAAAVWLRTRSLRLRQVEMERLVAQRTEELRQANEHLSRLSYVDALTGLANRRRFDQALAEEWRRARRAGAPLALLIADVDAFKTYNDLLGHLRGDQCLARVAQVFSGMPGRAGDVAARYGGEEFVLLLPGVTQDAALQVAEQLRAACEALGIEHPASPAAGVITLSVGVASCVPDGAGAAESLLDAADAALYRAKQLGRNRVCA